MKMNCKKSIYITLTYTVHGSPISLQEPMAIQVS